MVYTRHMAAVTKRNRVYLRCTDVEKGKLALAAERDGQTLTQWLLTLGRKRAMQVLSTAVSTMRAINASALVGR